MKNILIILFFLYILIHLSSCKDETVIYQIQDTKEHYINVYTYNLSCKLSENETYKYCYINIPTTSIIQDILIKQNYGSNKCIENKNFSVDKDLLEIKVYKNCSAYFIITYTL